jgi:hypothetical protein
MIPIEIKGKNGNIGGATSHLPPSPLSASGTGGGRGFVVPPPKTAFYVMKTIGKHLKQRQQKVVPCGDVDY